jgi:hypothetical protein
MPTVPTIPNNTASNAVSNQSNNDASKVLQNLLGLSNLVDQFQDAIVSALTSESVTEKFSSALKTGWSNIVANGSLEKTITGVLKNLLTDESSKTGITNILNAAITSENAKGVVSEGVYAGFKRLVADADAQKNIVTIGGKMIASQDMTNVVNLILNGFSTRLKEYFASREFASAISENSNKVIASMQEIFSLSVKEGIESLRGISLTLKAQ